MTDVDPTRAPISQLQDLMAEGALTALGLLEAFLDRIDAIDRRGPSIRSIIEINPQAQEIAAALDRERRQGHVRGPLHGIPVLLKDNIDTADAMETTAGSLALLGSRPARDASVAEKLRRAGALVLGKANMSEWANIRSTHSSSGWSARGGQARNPYALERSACGSSSGSASAVSAGLASVSLGTETDGSILCPASFNGVVGIKPTVGLTSRTGVIPIAHSQDTVGPFGRTMEDAAVLLGAITGVDDRDPATATSDGRFHTDYRPFLQRDGLRGARLGVPREVFFGYSPKTDAIIEEALRAMRDAGATLVDPADIPTAKQMREDESELTVLVYELKADLNAYLADRPGAPRSLQEIIAFNEEHAAKEMPYFGQETFLMAQEKGPLTDSAYLEALETNRRLSREEGIDAVMEEHSLDALVMPTASPAFLIDLIRGDAYSGGSSGPAALAGYPAISVPTGHVFGLPVGVTFMGRAFSEPTLIRLAYAFEQATLARREPEFRRQDPAAPA